MILDQPNELRIVFETDYTWKTCNAPAKRLWNDEWKEFWLNTNIQISLNVYNIFENMMIYLLEYTIDSSNITTTHPLSCWFHQKWCHMMKPKQTHPSNDLLLSVIANHIRLPLPPPPWTKIQKSANRTSEAKINIFWNFFSLLSL